MVFQTLQGVVIRQSEWNLAQIIAVIIVIDFNQNFQISSLSEGLLIRKGELPLKWSLAAQNTNLSISNLSQQWCNSVPILDPTGS